MPLRHDIHELLEDIQKELPGHTHEAYEKAVNRAMRQPRHQHHHHEHHRGRPMGWALLEQMLFPAQHRHQQEEEGAIAFFMLILGLIGGAALMYLFDPERGEQRRAMLRGEVSKVAHEAEASLEHVEQRARTEAEEIAGYVRDDVEKAVGEAEDAAKHVSKAAAGASAGAAKAVEGEVKSTSPRLVAQVEAEVKALVKDPGAIEVKVRNGVVSLHGRVLAHEVKALVEKIEALPGVRSVEDHLEVHDATEK